MKKMEYKTRKWHDKCFQCVVCKTQVGSKPFIIPNETDVYCVGCFEEKFATKCTKCKKIMTTGGVTFKNEVSYSVFPGCAIMSLIMPILGVASGVFRLHQLPDDTGWPKVCVEAR